MLNTGITIRTTFQKTFNTETDIHNLIIVTYSKIGAELGGKSCEAECSMSSMLPCRKTFFEKQQSSE